MPAGVSPYLPRVRAESEPWLVPIRIARPSSLHLRTSGVKSSSIVSSSLA